MGDGKITGTRAAHSLWLRVFLLLTCGFTPPLMAQSLPCPLHVFVRERAAVAYDKYQRCGLKGSRRLLVTGW